MYYMLVFSKIVSWYRISAFEKGIIMNKNTTTNSALATEPKLSVILNGGSDVLESARIPIQFGVNNALAEIQPTHVLVIIQHESETKPCYGIRKLIPLSRGSDFICFDSAGKHTVTFIALKSSLGSQVIENKMEVYLKEHRPGCYCYYVDLNGNTDTHGISFEHGDDACYVVAVFTKTISLPKELFATKPKSWVWNWANLWHRYEPTDQCSYRKRLFFAFSLKPIIWFVVAVIAKYLWATMSSIWLITAKTTANFLGWRSEPIFNDFDIIWDWHSWNPGQVDWDITRGYDYGVWDREHGKEKYYPITGSAVLMIAVFGLLFYTLLDIILEAFWKDKGLWIVVFAVGVIVIFCGCTLLRSLIRLHFVEKTGDYIRTQWDTETTQRRQISVGKQKPLYFQWLRDTLNTDRLPKKVDLSTVPVAFKQPLVHKFRLSFNAAKAKVCKPFPRH